MAETALLDAWNRLPLPDRLAFLQAALLSIYREFGEGASSMESSAEDDRERKAAHSLLKDYLTDPELTAFSAIDGDEILEAR
jgi:hypothetical protein